MAFSVLALVVFFASAVAVLAADSIALIGYNDQHAHIQPSDYNYLLCPKGGKTLQSNCPGGFARIATAVKRWRNQHPSDNIFVQAGDEFIGTPWTTYYKGKEAAWFDNAVGVQVGTLGNHDFDLGTKVLASNFVKKINYPLTVCNIQLNSSSALYGLRKMKTGPVVRKLPSGVKVGFVGWVTLETLVDDNVGAGLQILDYAAPVQSCIDQLKKQGINYIVGLGHAGIDADEGVIKSTSGLSFVIGGHSHTFMWPPTSANNASLPAPCQNFYCDQDNIDASPYPQVVGDKGGRQVPYFQAKWGTHYMDTVKAFFNADGSVDLTKLTAYPILLGGVNSSNHVRPDPEVQALVDKYSPPIDALSSVIHGYSDVELPRPNAFSDSSRNLNETQLGDIVTDGMVYYFQQLAGYPAFVKQYGPVEIAITNPGGLRVNLPTGAITQGACTAVLPFGDYNIVTAMDGKLLENSLLYNMLSLGPQNADFNEGNFYPQVYSGAKISVTISGTQNTTSGKFTSTSITLNSLLVKYNGVFEPIDYAKTYYVVTTNYLNDQEDSFFLSSASVVYNFGLTQDITMCNYLSAFYATPQTAFSKPLDGRLQVVYTVTKTVS